MIRRLQHGFSLVTAIFLLVVLASLGAMMMTFFTNQQQSTALDITGSRAYQAARAGIEWGAYQIAQSAVVPGFAANCQAAATTTAVALAGSLAGFSLNVGCAAASAVEGTNNVWIYRLTSTAAQGTVGQPDYVERQVSAAIEQ